MPKVILVDLDGTLAHYDKWQSDGGIGKPIPLMVLRVLRWLKEGHEVRIFTARVAREGRASESGHDATLEFVEDQIDKIQKWCQTHIGMVLPITAVKGYDASEIWDDRAIQVVKNTGLTVEELLESRKV